MNDSTMNTPEKDSSGKGNPGKENPGTGNPGKSKLDIVLRQIDAYNQQDPHSFAWEDQIWPMEYFLSMRVYEWVEKLSPQPEDTLLIAGRGNHIGRWEIP